MTHHDSSDVFRVISIQVKLEGHHLVIVCLQLTLHHPVHFIRELQRGTGSMLMTGACWLSETLSTVKHRGEQYVFVYVWMCEQTWGHVCESAITCSMFIVCVHCTVHFLKHCMHMWLCMICLCPPPVQICSLKDHRVSRSEEKCTAVAGERTAELLIMLHNQGGATPLAHK